MKLIEISDNFHNFLDVVEKRFIKEDRWDRSYDYHADPIFFCSVIRFGNIILIVNLVES